MERQRKQAEDAAIAKEKKLKHLKAEIEKATRVLNERVDAWKQAGSPDIKQQELERAKEEANRLLSLFHEAKMKNRITSFKIGYLRLAYFTRKTASRLSMPWFVTAMIVGTIAFACVSLVALLFINSLAINFALGGIGFVSGCLATVCLLFFPSNNEATTKLSSLRQNKRRYLKPLEAAKVAYEEKQQEYDKLAILHKLRAECKNASLEKKRLEEKYQAACDE